MSIVAIVVALALIGVLMWLVNTYVPMAAPFKKVLNIVVLCAVILWLLKVFGIWAYLSEARI